MLKMKMFQGFRSSGSNGVDTIGKSAKNYGAHVEFVLFHRFHVEISWIKGGPGKHSGGWGLGHSGAPWGPGIHKCILETLYDT